MGLLAKILISAVAVIISAYLIPGVGVDSILTAIIVAIVLGLLNAIVKPILVILTIPVTILTLGLFLLVINVIIIYLADYLVPGFSVSGFFAALFFSIVLAIVGWILDSIF
ncbi:phage holin family protein [Rhodocytophaga rosea]|uniref:Phage holin family protein n=1 Tax=Rhodocytophaga rosea TaxID=2704465 RepID=A0A6C0GEJ8_9BACT|nr:phage holin family protein [Rhodocytophaga rosea]QHT66439.1 phage holin family protein [Rhodocytophaga rosea]